MTDKQEKLIDKKGIRLDGRKADSLIPNFDESFLLMDHTLNMVKTRFLSVFSVEVHPKHLSKPDQWYQMSLPP